MKFLSILLLFFSLLFFSTMAAAEVSRTTLQFDGSWIYQKESGGELAGSWLVAPISNRGIWIGPRFGVGIAGRDSGSRWDLQWGGEARIWFVNFLGVGLQAEVLAPSYSYSNGGFSLGQAHYRLTPNISTRIFRLGKEGAWAVQLGIPYDTVDHWGVRVGLSLQLAGVFSPN